MIVTSGSLWGRTQGKLKSLAQSATVTGVQRLNLGRDGKEGGGD